jgi:hypothetical protein
MVNTKFIGRLGNSMFQIAACIGYAKKYGYSWGVPNNQGESSILTHFPDLPRCDASQKRWCEHQKQWDHEWFNYHEIPDQGPDVTLFGFYQSWKYFENAQEEVRQAFKLDHIPGYEDYVSLHVRRGDYVQHANSFPPINEDYIFQAISLIRSADNARGLPEKKILWFSDDKLWCEEMLRQIPGGHKISNGNEYEDLSLMASCGHHIIANSTFSWWASYLSHNPEAIVISPSCERGNWFGMESGVKHDCIDLLPHPWHQIKFR